MTGITKGKFRSPDPYGTKGCGQENGRLGIAAQKNGSLQQSLHPAERQQDLGSASYCCGPNAGM